MAHSSPAGINRALIELAGSSILFTPVLSNVCLLEFYRNAINGLGKRAFSEQEIRTFLRYFIEPILDEYPSVNSVVGRYSIDTIIQENRPIGEVLVHLSACSVEEAHTIVSQQPMREPLHRFDQDDFHVWVTAIQQECDLILTSNYKRFPSQIGNIKRIHPRDFYSNLVE